MKSLYISMLILISISSTLGGNGVERGRVVNTSSFGLKTQIKNYLGKQLSNCHMQSKNDSFMVNKIEVEEDEVDQGIVDLYYKMDITHHNQYGNKINDLSVEIEDADYSNWRSYEEKLSLSVTKDINAFCIQ